jgi:hypothetical protein
MAAWIAFQSGNFAHSVLVVVFSFSAGGVAAAGAVTVLRVLPGGLLAPLASSLATSTRPELHLGIGIRRLTARRWRSTATGNNQPYAAPDQ